MLHAAASSGTGRSSRFLPSNSIASEGSNFSDLLQELRSHSARFSLRRDSRHNFCLRRYTQAPAQNCRLAKRERHQPRAIKRAAPNSTNAALIPRRFRYLRIAMLHRDSLPPRSSQDTRDLSPRAETDWGNRAGNFHVKHAKRSESP
jgi:hypothetical protein